MKRILLLLAALVFSAGLAQAQPRIAYWQAISPLAAPVFTGQWTVNGSLCAAGQVVQGGSPTTCTGGPTLSTGLIIGSGTVDANHQIAVTVSVNGEAGDRLVNSSTGVGAFVNRVIQSGSTLAYVGVSNQNYTGSVGGAADAKRSWLDTATVSGAGWDYSAPAANGTHRFYTAGYAASNLRATIDATGLALVGTYTGTWGSPSESVTRTATSSNIVLTSASSPLQSVVPGAALNVTLPTAAAGMHFSIHDGAAFTLTIKDAAAATITTLVNGQTVNVVYDGTSWVVW